MAIDTHTHITDARFDTDREEVIKRAHNIGITKIFEVVCEQNLWNKGVEIAKKDNIF
ncbi:MAG: TatD family hydrolase, partial [Elusimicrobiota bacterium]|nr:TatD family hydrolase [Elusimicrobiota bacterium]